MNGSKTGLKVLLRITSKLYDQVRLFTGWENINLVNANCRLSCRTNLLFVSQSDSNDFILESGYKPTLQGI